MPDRRRSGHGLSFLRAAMSMTGGADRFIRNSGRQLYERGAVSRNRQAALNRRVGTRPKLGGNSRAGLARIAKEEPATEPCPRRTALDGRRSHSGFFRVEDFADLAGQGFQGEGFLQEAG